MRRTYALILIAFMAGLIVAPPLNVRAQAIFAGTPAELIAAIQSIGGGTGTIVLTNDIVFETSNPDFALDGNNATPPISGNVTIIGNDFDVRRSAPAEECPSLFEIFEPEIVSPASPQLRSMQSAPSLPQMDETLSPAFFRLFAVDSGGTLNLYSVNVRGGCTGETSSFGGGVYVFNGTLNTFGGAFTDNFAIGGGAIGTAFNDDSTINVNGSTFSDNVGVLFGGAIFAYGEMGGSLTIRNSALRDNASLFGGGGVAAIGIPVTIRNTTIDGNFSQLGGALIFERANVTISRSTISNNQAGTGYAISVGFGESGQQIDISASTISDNRLYPDFDFGFGMEDGGVISGFEDSDDYVISVTYSTIYNPGEAAFKDVFVNVSNSLIGGADDNCDFGFSGGLTDFGGNIEETFMSVCGLTNMVDDLELGPLANNGGFNQTRLPAPSSPAIDNIGCSPDGTTDQRSISRPQMAACDSGAVERLEDESALGIVRVEFETDSSTATPGETVEIGYRLITNPTVSDVQVFITSSLGELYSGTLSTANPVGTLNVEIPSTASMGEVVQLNIAAIVGESNIGTPSRHRVTVTDVQPTFPTAVPTIPPADEPADEAAGEPEAAIPQPEELGIVELPATGETPVWAATLRAWLDVFSGGE